MNDAQQAGKLAETETLQRQLFEMQAELERTKAENAHQSANEKLHMDRIAALEEKAALAADPGTPGTGTPGADETKLSADTLNGTKILNQPLAAETAPTTLAKQLTKKPDAKNLAATAKSNFTELKKEALAEVKTSAKAKPAAKVAAATPKQQPKAVAKKAKPAAKPQVKPAAKIKTSSIKRTKTKPIDFGPAVITHATRPIGVRIATGPSVDSLRLSWSALADRHGPALKKLEPRYVTGIDATGLTYDLVAGPIATAKEAKEVCNRLRTNGVRCTIGEFTGNAL